MQDWAADSLTAIYDGHISVVGVGGDVIYDTLYRCGGNVYFRPREPSLRIIDSLKWSTRSNRQVVLSGVFKIENTGFVYCVSWNDRQHLPTRCFLARESDWVFSSNDSLVWSFYLWPDSTTAN